MDWSKHRALSERWISETRRYVSAINAFVDRGERDGWENVGAEPEDTRQDMAGEVVAIVKAANESGAAHELRQFFPPAHRPFVEMLDERAFGIYGLVWIDDETVVASVGAPWGLDGVVAFKTDGTTALLPAAVAVARTPDRRYFAVAHDREILVREGWEGPVIRRLRMPTGDEGVKTAKVRVSAGDQVIVEALHLFPDASKALVVMPEGVFVCAEVGVTRVFPTSLDLADEIDNLIDEGEDELVLSYDMIHAGLSADGKLIAAGSQDSQHLLMSADGEVIAKFGPVHSSYPHHAAFSPDSRFVCFNSCHFYNGVTVGAPVDELRGFSHPEYEDDARLTVVDEGCRVYASTYYDNMFVFGDAGGYLHARHLDGSKGWQHFCGSTIGGIDTSPCGGKLAVGTAAGFLQLIDMDVETPSPHQIGTGSHVETLRFVAWKGERIWRW